MRHYKSWPGLQKQLTERLCAELKERLTYFLTYYSDVHNAYGRASIRLDGKELVCFSWINAYYQERDLSLLYKETGEYSFDEPSLVEKWKKNGTYSEKDFLDAATEFLLLPINEALESENVIIRILALVDRRTGKATLAKLKSAWQMQELPLWVCKFLDLRLSL